MKVPKIKVPKMKLPKVKLFKLRWLNKQDLDNMKNWDFVTIFCKVSVFCIIYALAAGFSPDPVQGFLFNLATTVFLGAMGALLIGIVIGAIAMMIDLNRY